MSQNKTLKIYRRLVLLLLGATFISVTYNNCGQYQAERGEHDPTVSKFEKAVLMLRANPQPGLCEESVNYKCLQHQFSSNVEDGMDTVRFPCQKVDGGLDICVDGQIRTHDSTGAKELYEFDEFECVIEPVKIEGAYAIHAEAETLQDSLKAVYEKCLLATSEEKQ